MTDVFAVLTASDIARLVQSAKRRVIYSAPGQTQDIAAAVVTASSRLPGRVEVILDVTPQSARLGYGEFGAVTLLRENGVGVRMQNGLRIGFVAVDGLGFAFNLPPLLVEDVKEMNGAFNAIALESQQIEKTIQAISPPVAAPDVTSQPDANLQPNPALTPNSAVTPSIGKAPVSAATLRRPARRNEARDHVQGGYVRDAQGPGVPGGGQGCLSL